MLKNKKSTSTITALVMIVIAIISAFAVLKTGSKVLAIVLGTESTAIVDAQNIAGALQKGIKSSAARCIIYYSELRLDKPPEMSQEYGKIQFYQFDKPMEKYYEGMDGPFYKPSGRSHRLDIEPIEAKLCLVEGAGAKNLYSNVMGKTSPSPENPEYIELDKYTIELVKDTIQTEDYEDYREWVYDVIKSYDNDHGKSNSILKAYLYKADSNHICPLAVVIDTGKECADWGERIDTDCLNQWVDDKIFECNFLYMYFNVGGVFLCDDEHCLNDPPTKPWRRTTANIGSICDITPLPQDSAPDGDKICGQIGSIRIIGNYDVRLHENKNYGGKKICFSDEGDYRLDDYPIESGNGWNQDTDSVKILADGDCTNPGVTEG